MQGNAQRALDTTDAQEYLWISMYVMAACSQARDMVDVNIAAGVAEQELGALVARSGHAEEPRPEADTKE